MENGKSLKIEFLESINRSSSLEDANDIPFKRDASIQNNAGRFEHDRE